MKMNPYHPQTNIHVEWCYKAIVACVRHHVATHQREWNLFLQLLACANNNQVYRSTNTTVLSFVLTKHPPTLTTFHNPSKMSGFTQATGQDLIISTILSRHSILHAFKKEMHVVGTSLNFLNSKEVSRARCRSTQASQWDCRRRPAQNLTRRLKKGFPIFHASVTDHRRWPKQNSMLAALIP